MEKAPPTRAEPVEDILHGERFVDPFRWLEDGDSPEVREWVRSQDAYARHVLRGSTRRASIHRRLEPLLSVGLITAPLPRRGSYFFQKRAGLEEQPLLYVRKGLAGGDRMLLDPARGGVARALDWYAPSLDGSLLAYGLSEGGTEKSTLHLKDVETGIDLPDLIPWTRACSVAWRGDSGSFFYTRYPAPGEVPAGEENYHRRVFEHVLGTDYHEDPLVFGEGRSAEDWPSIELSPDGRWLLVTVSVGWTRTDVYLLDLREGGRTRTVIEGQEVIVDGTIRNDRLILRTNLGAPRFRLVEAGLLEPGVGSWRELVPEGEDVLEQFALVGESLLVHTLHEASSRLGLLAKDGSGGRAVPLPGLGTVGAVLGETVGEEAFFAFTSFVHPGSVFRLSLPTGSLDLWAKVEVDWRPEDYTVDLEWTKSLDGTPISYFVLYRKERPSDGSGPAILTGYGGFGLSLTPSFGRSLPLFLDAGGLYAVAHLRGGGEYGEDWHRAGMRSVKQRVFEDFFAVSRALKEKGRAATNRLAIIGGSNGGLLMGAALTQEPELYASVVCQVPLLDMLRYHRFRIARLWIPEYGSSDDEEAFRVLRAYSPYHHVAEGRTYPPVLFTTSDGDSRVDPLHARKMAARLQQASSGVVLLRVEEAGGHGQGKPLSKVLEESTDVWTFLFETLRVPAP